MDTKKEELFLGILIFTSLRCYQIPKNNTNYEY
jgi:hypothetical protein